MKRYYARYWWSEPDWCERPRPWIVLRRVALVRNAGGDGVSRHETRKAAREAARALNEKEQEYGQS